MRQQDERGTGAPRWLPASRAAKHFDISRPSFYRKMVSGVIPAVCVNRSVEPWLVDIIHLELLIARGEVVIRERRAGSRRPESGRPDSIVIKRHTARGHAGHSFHHGHKAARMCAASFSLTSHHHYPSHHHYQGLQNPISSPECQHQSGERGFIVGSAEIGEVLQPASDISDQVLVEADLAATS
jgi:hypothetical protein